MNKQAFLTHLCKGLSGLPKEDIEERISFYTEMIDDRTEEGLTEEEAVSEIGNIDEIIAQIIADTPLSKLVKEKMKPGKKLRAWEITLLVLGAPLWLPLLIAAFAVVLSLYVSLWAVVISLGAVFGSLILCAIADVCACLFFMFGGHGVPALVILAAGLVCAGLAILMFYVVKGAFVLSKNIIVWMKNCFVGKETAQ